MWCTGPSLYVWWASYIGLQRSHQGGPKFFVYLTWYDSTEGGIGQLLTIQQVEQVAYFKIVQFKLLLSMTEFPIVGKGVVVAE